MTAALSTEGLTRRFGSRLAVENVNLTVNQGDVYGLLGLNGAGKTTTIRLVLGLVRPTGGRISIFGKDLASRHKECMREIGSLVEGPAYYPNLSAEMNLEVLRLATPGVSRARLGEVLDLVGLAARGRDRVRTFSQGMRQRLGIAMAFLGNPRLVILDEPSNGLDPEGTRTIRDAIVSLNRSGVTFIVSSHLLREIELISNRVGVMKDGKLALEGDTRKLLAGPGTEVRVRTPDPEAAIEILRTNPAILKAWQEPDRTVRAALVSSGREAEIVAALVRGGVPVQEFGPIPRALEDLVLGL